MPTGSAPALGTPPGPASAPERGGQGRSVTRDEVVRLGQSGRPWDFLPLGMAAVKAAAADAGIRFLLAANLAKLGLVTAAREHLGVLAELGIPAGEPSVAALTAAMAALPDDRVPTSGQLETCRWNLEVLAARGMDLEPEFERWAIAQAGCEWFRTLDGNLVRRRGEVWLGLADHKGAAARFAERQFAGPEPQEVYTIEGIDPPWLLLEVSGRTPAARSGFRPMLCVVQADRREFLDGLAYADLSGVLRDERVHLFVGPSAAEGFARHLRSRLHTKITGPCIPLPSTRVRAEPDPQAVILAAMQEQVREHERLAAAVAGIYAGRDRRWWRERYAAGLAPGSTDPLRVLVPTTRHSTFLRHSAADLAEACRAKGLRAELIVEPDDHAQHSSLAYLRTLESFRPDLVILINCFRSHLGPWFPALPYVCWIQDAMRHQFSAEAAAGRGELDFIAGHLHPELFGRFGFGRERTLSCPVVASERKFHAGAIAPAHRDRFACDIAFVSHHSETPAAMHGRLLAEAGGDRTAARVMERLRPEIERIAADALGGEQVLRLEAATAGAIAQETGQAPPERSVTLFFHQYTLPLAERCFRHEALHWAADLAERRGWGLRIFGRGWEGHERFAAHASGEVEHGEELRACYQAAGVHLHISITAMVHQRIMECALSGGLPLSRLNSSALYMVEAAAKRDIWLSGRPELFDAETQRHGFVVADSPGLMRLMSLRQRLGLEHSAVYWSRQINMEKLRAHGPVSAERRPDWVLGDLSETTFRSRAELEGLIERALCSPGWRGGVSAMMAGRVRERLTHSALVGNILGMVGGTLA